MSSPLLLAAIVGGLVFFPVLGNLRPDLVSFLPSMRQYAGNCASATWAFAPGAEAKLDNVARPAGNTVDQVADTYPRPVSEMLLTMPLAWRALHSQGPALLSLMVKHLGDDIDTYSQREAEFGCNTIVGFNLGDGHFHDEQLPLQVTWTLRRVGEPIDTTDAVVATVAHERPPAGTRAV